MQKKNRELRIVHNLQKLSGVTIQDTGVPPILDEFVEAYAGQSVCFMLDMYWRFYARILDPNSQKTWELLNVAVSASHVILSCDWEIFCSVCVCVFLLYSVQLGGQRSPLSTTALKVCLAYS